MFSTGSALALLTAAHAEYAWAIRDGRETGSLRVARYADFSSDEPGPFTLSLNGVAAGGRGSEWRDCSIGWPKP